MPFALRFPGESRRFAHGIAFPTPHSELCFQSGFSGDLGDSLVGMKAFKRALTVAYSGLLPRFVHSIGSFW